jgi:hypothetical protein
VALRAHSLHGVFTLAIRQVRMLRLGKRREGETGQYEKKIVRSRS